MTEQQHQYRVLESGKTLNKASKVLIAVHGRGGSAEQMLTFAKEFTSSDWHIMAPQAKNNTWYPYSFMAPESSNQPWLDSAVSYLETVIHSAVDVVGMRNVFLLGFSQGACLTIEVAARNAGQYGCVLVFTGGLIGEKLQKNNYKGNFLNSKIYMSNGDSDPHVPLQRSKDTNKILQTLGANVMLDIYPNRPHTITQEEIEYARKFVFE